MAPLSLSSPSPFSPSLSLFSFSLLSPPSPSLSLLLLLLPLPSPSLPLPSPSLSPLLSFSLLPPSLLRFLEYIPTILTGSLVNRMCSVDRFVTVANMFIRNPHTPYVTTLFRSLFSRCTLCYKCVWFIYTRMLHANVDTAHCVNPCTQCIKHAFWYTTSTWNYQWHHSRATTFTPVLYSERKSTLSVSGSKARVFPRHYYKYICRMEHAVNKQSKAKKISCCIQR